MKCNGLFFSMGVLLLTAVTACSTQKNTAASRFYQSTVTRYNVYFNGNEAFKKGYEAQEKAKKDNLQEVIDMFPVSDEKVRATGKSDFDVAIEKAKKSIKLHSITEKPKKKKGTPTEAEKRWMEKKEYNPFLWKAWFLMADAQMQEGEFIEAASTYSYMTKLYFDEPEIVAEAQYKMAQCYSELGWNYESDELFQRAGQTRTDMTRQMDYKARMASHLLQQERYDECIPLLEEVAGRKGAGKTQRIREAYLLAQLYKATGQNDKAYQAFGKVIRMSPPYNIEFYARIQQTETMAQNSSVNKIMKKLKRMERDPSNKDNLDQVYYAMGNIHLLRGDTATALGLYNEGVDKTDRNSLEKGVLLLTMADLYWNMADYANASRCYSKAIGMTDKSNKDYETIKLRSEVLEDLVGYVSTVTLQDSLQHLATLPDDELDRIIDRLILEYEEQERLEEEKLKQEARDEAHRNDMSSLSVEEKPEDDGSWYFYNEKIVELGRKEFRKTWGNRVLEDDWRRTNKTVLETDRDNAPLPADSALFIPGDSLDLASDSLSALSEDPHNRQYYIKQIPFTPEAIEQSDKLISRALLGAGIIYKDRLTEYPDAEKALTRITADYPEADEADEAMYNLYLMYSLWGRTVQADSCKARMQRLYPESDYTMMVCDPDYIDNAKYGKHREDSLYVEAFTAFRAGDTLLVRKDCNVSASRYPKGRNRAKFMFLEATLSLEAGNTDAFMAALKELVSKYPKEDISQFAGLIATGIQNGRILQSTQFASIWDRRNGTADHTARADSLLPQFSDDRYQPFMFLLAYPEGELNENQLLFEIARYNFSNYMMRGFDLSFMKEQGIGMLKVSEFMNFDEAFVYSRNLYSDAGMAEKLSGIKAVIITEKNLETLLEYYSFNDWQEFYEEHFLNIPEFELDASTLFEEPDNGE